MNYLKLFALLTLLISTSCKDKLSDCTDDDYRGCNSQRPEWGYARALITINEENPQVILRVYEGNFEENRLWLQDTVRIKGYYLNLETEKYYSMTATYRRGNDTVMAIDGGKIKISSYRACELRCYEMNEPDFDLTID